jgi:hypothetical protein
MVGTWPWSEPGHGRATCRTYTAKGASVNGLNQFVQDIWISFLREDEYLRQFRDFYARAVETLATATPGATAAGDGWRRRGWKASAPETKGTSWRCFNTSCPKPWPDRDPAMRLQEKRQTITAQLAKKFDDHGPIGK